MKKLFIILIMILGIVLPIVNAIDYEIYETDTTQIENGTFSRNSITHIRDNYYGIAYTGNDSDGFLRIIELDNNYNIIDTNVDLWEFDTNYAGYPTIMNFNSSTGLSVIGYLSKSGGGYNQITYRSFVLSSSGVITSTDAGISLPGSSTNIIGSLDVIKTGTTTFLGSGVNVFSSLSYIEYAGGTVASDGTLTLGTQRRTGCMDLITSSNYNFEKTGSTCTGFFSMQSGSAGKRYSVTCSDTDTSGTYVTYSCSSTITPPQWESATVNDLDVTHDTDGGYYILSYGETASDYPVISTIDETTLAVTDKIRIQNDTSSENAIYYQDANSVFTVYDIGGDLIARTYLIDSGTGVLTEEFNKNLSLTSSNIAFGNIPSSVDDFIMSYTSSSGDVTTLGVGLPLPPTPEDTEVVIRDEKTLGIYDLTNKNLTFYAHCEDNVDYQEDITNSTQSIPVDCDYLSFSVKVEYEINNITYSYKRYYLRDLTDTYGQFDLDIYLVDPYTTEYVQNEFIIDDLTDRYQNAKLYFEKNVNGVTTQITAAQIDLTNSMRAVLINGDTYYVYLENEDGEINYLGEYVAPASGVSIESTVLKLHDIQLKFDTSKVTDKFGYYVYSEDNIVEYLVQTLEGIDPNLINMTLNIYNGTLDTGTLIYNVNKGGAYDVNNLSAIFSDTGINLTAYENNSVSFELSIYFYDDEINQLVYEGYLWENHKIELPIEQYLPEGFMNWFILILLSVIAVYATTKTADFTALGILILAGVFVMFGWYTVGSGVIALAIMITLLNVIRKGA